MNLQQPLPREIWIFDTSSLISIKQDYFADMEDILSRLEERMPELTIGFPPRVVEELTGKKFVKEIDRLGEWAKEAQRNILRKYFIPEDVYVKKVLRVAPTLLDRAKIASGKKEADHYVLAIALQLIEAGNDVTVVTEEFKDFGKSKKRPQGKTSMKTAGEQLGVPTVNLREFLEEQGWL